MTVRINGVDAPTLHEVSLLCQAHVALGLKTDELGAVYVGDEPHLHVLRSELQAISHVAVGETALACERALAALEGADP